VQRHPAKNQILHLDLQRVLEDEKIRMMVPLHFTGESVAPGVKTQGGVVSHHLNQVHVYCLPKHLPEFLTVDVSEMEMNQIKRMSDIPLPEGVELADLSESYNEPVVSVHHARAAEVEPVAAEVAAAVPAPGAPPAPAAAAPPAAAEPKKEAGKK
jgi:large subunit ribosomal protein L25